MLITTLFHELAWSPIFVVWMIVNVSPLIFGKEYRASVEWKQWVVLFTEIANYVRYICVYGGYGVMFLLILFTAYLLPVFRVQTGYGGNYANGLGLTFFYGLFSAGNIFAHEFFAPTLQQWAASMASAIEKGPVKKPAKKDEKKEDAAKKPDEAEKKTPDKIEEGSNWNEKNDNSFNVDDFDFNNFSSKKNYMMESISNASKLMDQIETEQYF